MPKMGKELEINFEEEDEIASEIVPIVNDNIKKFRGYYMKIEGESDAGKTHLYLSIFGKLKSMGYKPEEVMMCIIDCDIEGQEDIFGKVVPPEYLPRIRRKIVTDVEEAYAWAEWYSTKLTSFISENPDRHVGFLVVENEWSYYQFTIEQYSTVSHGMPMRELLAQQQRKAIELTEKNREKAKKMVDPNKAKQLMRQVFKPVFEEGRRDAFKTINRNYSDLFRYLKLSARNGGFNLIVTTLRKETTVDWGKETEHKEIKTLGRPDLIDFIFNVILRLDAKNSKEGKVRTVFVQKSRKIDIPEGYVYPVGNGFEDLFKAFAEDKKIKAGEKE